MSEIPSDFFGKEWFKSLPRLAFITWLLVFIIDAIILQRIPYTFSRVAWIWIIAFVISFLLEWGRYNNMSREEKGVYKKYFMLINAFIIFLYASSYTGLTKEIGAWGELRNSLTQNEKLQSTVSLQEIKPEKTFDEKEKPKKPESVTKRFDFFMAAIEWALPVFAKQTSYFPDVRAISENNELKIENKSLNEKLLNIQSPDASGYLDRISGLVKDSIDKSNQINKLNDLIAGQKPTDCSSYISDINRLNNILNSLRGDLDGFMPRVRALNTSVSELATRRKQLASCINSWFNNLREFCGKEDPKAVSEYLSILNRLAPIDIPNLDQK